jgi:outer membrane lipoprotein SlyB
MRKAITVSAIVCSLVFGAVVPGQAQQNPFGALIGGASGAAIGAAAGKGKAGGIIAGALVGAVLGQILANMDAQSKAQRQQAVKSTVGKPAGSTTNWKSKDASGTIKVAKVEKMPDGKTCRTVQETITFQGKPSTEERQECA